jgi:hypothetical protein
VPGPKDKERGIRKPFKMRFGIQVDGPIGIIKQRDPGAIPPNAFQNAVNVVRSGNRIVSRGGQSLLVSGMAGNITGMIETSAGDDAGGVGASVVFHAQHQLTGYLNDPGLDRYNEDLSPAYSGWLFPQSPTGSPINSFNMATEPDTPFRTLLSIDGSIYSYAGWSSGVGDNGFYKIVVPDKGSDPTTQQGRVSYQEVFTFPTSSASGVFPAAGGITAQSFCVRDEKDANAPTDPSGQPSIQHIIYAGCDDGLVRRYDWRSLTVDSPQLIPGSTPFSTLVLNYNDQIVVIGSGTAPDANFFFVRKSAGVWQSYPLPATLVGRLHPHEGVVFQGVAYFACHDNTNGGGTGAGVVLSFDGTTVKEARRPFNCYRVKRVNVFAGMLTFCQITFTTGVDLVVGTYDGTTWTDNALDIGPANNPTWGAVVPIGNYLFLCVATNNTDTGGVSRTGVIYRSASLALTPLTLIKIIDTDPSLIGVSVSPYCPMDAVAMP